MVCTYDLIVWQIEPGATKYGCSGLVKFYLERLKGVAFLVHAYRMNRAVKI